MIGNRQRTAQELGEGTDSDSVPLRLSNLDLDWQDFAECSTEDTSLFFPERGASTKEAKAVCRDCIVREECLEYALVYEKHGIWGGTSERERKRIRKQRANAAAQYVTKVTIET